MTNPDAFTPKFHLLQKVFFGYAKFIDTYKKCHDCDENGKMKVTKQSGQEILITCLTCDGCNNGRMIRFPDWVPDAWVLTVGQVRIEATTKYTNYSYMCKETGIGSGQVYKEEMLSESEEEAYVRAKELVDEIKRQHRGEIT